MRSADRRKVTAFFRLDAALGSNFGPLFGFVGHELAEVGRRACQRRAAQIGEPHLDIGIREARSCQSTRGAPAWVFWLLPASARRIRACRAPSTYVNMPSARDSRIASGSGSITRNGIPRTARSFANVSPAGPAPTIRTSPPDLLGIPRFPSAASTLARTPD